MGKPDHRVYIDTNVFIQLRDLKDLPWRSILRGEWIEIVVAPSVIEELDKFKVDREGRKRDRSRAALKLIREASSRPEMRLDLRNAGPRLSLQLANGARFDWAAHPALDPTRADDHLIAAALNGRAEGPTCLLSHDTGPVIRARLNGLEAHDAPDEWLLPDPVTTEAQEKAQLKRDLDAARATKPTLVLSFPQRGSEEGELSIRVPNLAPLPQALQKQLIEAVLERHPMERLRADRADFSMAILAYDRGLSGYAVDKYRSDYADFASRIEKHFAQLHVAMAAAGMAFPLKYEIENASHVTAANLIVGFRCAHNAVLFADAKDTERRLQRLRPPKPPERPRTDLERSAEMMRFQANGFQQEPRDPTAFYWQVRPEGTGADASLICAEFRAGQVWSNEIFIHPLSSLPYEEEAVIEVGATNTRTTIRETVRLRVATADAAWSDDDVLDRLPSWIARAISDYGLPD